MTEYEVIILGAGIIGSSLAMSLAELGARKIAVIDCDIAGSWSSSERNAGGIRARWHHPVNIRLSNVSISYYRSIKEEVGFRQVGYLWLSDELRWKEGESDRETQKREGIVVEELSPSELSSRWPFLDRLDGVFAAAFSPDDGLINANLLKRYYRERAAGLEVTFIDRRLVVGVEIEKRRVLLRTLIIPEGPSGEGIIERALLFGERAGDAPGENFVARRIVNAAGAWAPHVARFYGGEVPSRPVRRQVSVLHGKEADLSSAGMIVDTNGLYFHPEGGNIVAGYSPPDEPAGYRLDYEGEDFFIREIWPKMFARSSRFAQLKHLGGWAGLYEVSSDFSAVIGPVPGRRDLLFEIHSFSGHGVMQSYAAGRALAERIVRGRCDTVDLAPLSGSRFAEGRPLFEGAVHI